MSRLHVLGAAALVAAPLVAALALSSCGAADAEQSYMWRVYVPATSDAAITAYAAGNTDVAERLHNCVLAFQLLGNDLFDEQHRGTARCFNEAVRAQALAIEWRAQ